MAAFVPIVGRLLTAPGAMLNRGAMHADAALTIASLPTTGTGVCGIALALTTTTTITTRTITPVRPVVFA